MADDNAPAAPPIVEKLEVAVAEEDRATKKAAIAAQLSAANKSEREASLANAQKKFPGGGLAAGPGSLEAALEDDAASKAADQIRGQPGFDDIDLDEQFDMANTYAENIVDAQIYASGVGLTGEEYRKAVFVITLGIFADLDRSDILTSAAPRTRGNSGSRANRNKLAAAGVLEQTEQAYLLQNIDNIPYGNQAPGPDHLPRLIIVQTKENLLNKLTSSKKIDALMKVRPNDLSSLTPYIKIAKRDKFTGQERVREFKFSSHSPDLAAYFKDGISAGSEVGLKSFDFETTGKNFFTATRSLQGTMVLFFKSFSDLDTGGASGGGIPWTELLFNHVFDVAPETVEDGNFDFDIPGFDVDVARDRKAEIFVEIGYNFPDNAITANSELAQAVNDSKILLAIYPITTDFNFREDGAVELTISFTAAAEHNSDGSESNVLAIGSSETELIALKGARENLRTINTEINQSNKAERKTLAKKVKAAEEALTRKVETQRLSNYGKFIEYVYSRGRLYSFTVDEDDYRKGLLPEERIAANQVRLTQTEINEIIKGAQEGGLKGKGLEIREREVGQRTIAYFYLGDLLNYYASALVPPESRLVDFAPDTGPDLPQSREIVVGDYVFHIFPKLPEKNDAAAVEAFINGIDTRTINLSKLPVSVSIFNAFMYKNIMKHSTAVFTFDTFLKKAVPELIDNALTAYVSGRKWRTIKQSFTEGRMPISMSTVTGHAPGLFNHRGKLESLVEEGDDDLPPGEHDPESDGLDLDGIPASEAHKYEIKSISIDEILTAGTDNVVRDPRSFTIIHGSRVPVFGTGTGVSVVGQNEIEDQKKGIYHLSAGRDAGIVKNISFTQQSSRLKEMNLLKSLDSGANPDVGILKMPYDAEVTIFGNPSLYPGQYVVVNPAIAGVGTLASRKSIAARLGLGGLYVIIGIKTRLSSGLLESTLTCKFNNHKTEGTKSSNEV
jgi:hypothetical protein